MIVTKLDSRDDEKEKAAMTETTLTGYLKLGYLKLGSQPRCPHCGQCPDICLLLVCSSSPISGF